MARAVLRARTDHGEAELVGDPDRPLGWTLLLDGTAQSHVDLADPTHLEFEYVRRLGHVLDALDPLPPRPLRVLHLGGGGWTLPRYVAATRPGSAQRVLELDGGLVELVAQHLPADDQGIEVTVADARAGLAATPADDADVVVLDVFAGARIPAHLTTVPFLRDVARVLGPNGVFAANLADAAPFPFLRGQVATARQVFEEVLLVAAPEVRRGRRFGNVLLVAGAAGLPRERLARAVAADPFPARVEDADARGAPPVTETTAIPSPVPPAGFFGRPA